MAGLKRGGGFQPYLMWPLFALFLLYPLSRYASEFLLARLSQGALVDLRLQLSRKILAAALRQIEEIGSHRLLAALIDDIPAITGAIMTLPLICINAAVVISCLIYLGAISWMVLVAILCLMAFGILTYSIPARKAMYYFKLAREEADNLLKHFHTLTEGAKELKLHRKRRERFLENVLRETAFSYREHSLNGIRIYNMTASWGQSLFFVAVGILVFLMPLLKDIGPQILTEYTLVILYIMGPLQGLLTLSPSLGRANVAIKKVESLGLSLTSDVDVTEDSKCAGQFTDWKRIRLQQVAHTYKNEYHELDFLLGPLDVTLHSGEIIFIVGGNGSGKTTLAKVLVGLYAPEGGSIDLDGETITDQNRDLYRQLFSVVFSDFFLFESLLGLEAPDLDKLASDYLARLQLSSKVWIDNSRLSTINLSRGQRKRLALLTAYMEDRPIYLFDEWAADQDIIFKEFFYYELIADLKSRGKTVLVITHDDQYFHIADRIIKLGHGNLEYDSANTFSPHSLNSGSIPNRPRRRE